MHLYLLHCLYSASFLGIYTAYISCFNQSIYQKTPFLYFHFQLFFVLFSNQTRTKQEPKKKKMSEQTINQLKKMNALMVRNNATLLNVIAKSQEIAYENELLKINVAQLQSKVAQLQTKVGQMNDINNILHTNVSNITADYYNAENISDIFYFKEYMESAEFKKQYSAFKLFHYNVLQPSDSDDDDETEESDKENVAKKRLLSQLSNNNNNNNNNNDNNNNINATNCFDLFSTDEEYEFGEPPSKKRKIYHD